MITRWDFSYVSIDNLDKCGIVIISKCHMFCRYFLITPNNLFKAIVKELKCLLTDPNTDKRSADRCPASFAYPLSPFLLLGFWKKAIRTLWGHYHANRNTFRRSGYDNVVDLGKETRFRKSTNHMTLIGYKVNFVIVFLKEFPDTKWLCYNYFCYHCKVSWTLIWCMHFCKNARR